MSTVVLVARQFLRDRLRSTISWAVSIALVVAATAAFYPALEDALSGLGQDGGAIASVMGLTEGMDPSSPLGFTWTNLYANIIPWVLMALGISAGTAAIAGDEETGTLEYLLSKPVTRAHVVTARFAAMVVILFVVALASGLALLATAPLFDLTTEMTTTAADGSTVTNPGIAFDNVAWGTFAAFAVGLGTGAIAFAVGGATGRKGITMGLTSGFVIAGYVLYTLSNLTGDVEFLTWVSPWRWYVDDAMFVNGLSVDLLWPFVETAIALAATFWLFERRDLGH